ncbi:MAG TPA: ADP-ribosylglycohydrolase family protein [Candidatus Faecisoma merdavium]|nr:ADP-ribosylglycohydrolase family protein [Candidatus Faecisoma merdavium]
MWGAIIGDFAGSIYEFEQSKKVSIIKKPKLIEDNSFFSDDTILTIAIIDAILNNGDYKEYLKKYAKEYMNSVPKDLPYFEKMFSSGFAKWVYSDEEGHSNGNGAMMRISGVGYLFDSKEEIIKNARLATIPSHNNPSSIENATIVAMIIYLSRIGYSKEKIIETLNIDLKYVPFKEFNMTCDTTIDNCLYALFTSNNFEEAITKVISYGGDTDTNACIVGSMAEAMYGIDKEFINSIKNKLPKQFVDILNLAYQRVK